MNLNALAKEICEMEGGVENLTIAQVKETLKCALDCLCQCEAVDVLVMLKKHKEKHGL